MHMCPSIRFSVEYMSKHMNQSANVWHTHRTVSILEADHICKWCLEYEEQLPQVLNLQYFERHILASSIYLLLSPFLWFCSCLWCHWPCCTMSVLFKCLVFLVLTSKKLHSCLLYRFFMPWALVYSSSWAPVPFWVSFKQSFKMFIHSPALLTS